MLLASGFSARRVKSGSMANVLDMRGKATRQIIITAKNADQTYMLTSSSESTFDYCDQGIT